jgi:hypothetical protein
MSREMDEQLRKEMEYKRLGYNAFVTGILTKYLEWDRFAEKFGFVQFSVEIFQQLLDWVDEEMIQNIASQFGRTAKEAVLFYYKRVTLETLLEYVIMGLKYCYLGQVQYDTKVEDDIQSLTIRHHFGENWSKIISLEAREAFKSTLGMELDCEVSGNHVLISFPRHHNRLDERTTSLRR